MIIVMQTARIKFSYYWYMHAYAHLGDIYNVIRVAEVKRKLYHK